MNRTSSFRTLLAVLLPLFFVVSACDSGGSSDEGGIDNEFSFEIEPVSSSSTQTASVEKAQETVNGFSFFVDSKDVEEANTDERVFAVYFTGSESFSSSGVTQGLFGFLVRESGQPGEGSYNLVDGESKPSTSDFVGWLYKDLTDTQNTPFYILRSGTVDISTSNDNKLSGKLTATATEVTFTTTGISEKEVNVTGNFTARNADGWVNVFQYTDVSQ